MRRPRHDRSGQRLPSGCLPYRALTWPPAGLDSVRDLPRLTQARSLLVLLLATCKQTQLALDAVANVLDTRLSRDLGTMIERSEVELRELTAKIEALSAK
jgi:hypothetical protein